MKYPSLYISGNIINYELIEKLEHDNYMGQATKDFRLDKNARLRDEIGKAWTDANDYWRIFKRKTEQLKDNDRGTSETRNLWVVPFMELLGYHLSFQQQPEAIGEKDFDISHRATNLDGLPVMVASFKDSLDKKPEGQTRYRMSAHAVVQEYLNLTEHTYGLVTNGYSIRLLRDSGRISRLSYVEFDLNRIFEESLYPDFAMLYRLLHSSRMPVRREEAAECFLEKYHQESLAEGGRIRNHLSSSVELAIKRFAKELLLEPQNTMLREDVESGAVNAMKFYEELLKLIYRTLFILVIEERRLVFPEKLDAEGARLRDIYYRYYSLTRLRSLIDKRMVVQGHKHDIWQLLLRVFSIYEEPRYAKPLGLQALGSDLFKRDALYYIRRCTLSNKALLDTLYLLSYFEDKDKKTNVRVNYGALNVEEFGSVYEGLLEYEPDLTRDIASGNWIFGFKHSVGTSERSKSGSHYTPEELVQPLIKHSLDYLLDDRLKICRDAVTKNKWNGAQHKNKRQQLAEQHLLTLSVCDVACGSGHILISAARRIAEVLAAFVEEEEQPNPVAYRKAKREAIRHCIYGVDKNPLAVELCKVALWLEAHNPGEPLNFIDHHIKCGDAIVGLAHKNELENGIVEEAFKTLPGDEKEIAASFAKRNKQERKEKDQLTLDHYAQVNEEVEQLIEKFNLFKNLPEHTPEEIAQKEHAYRKYENSGEHIRLQQLADAQVAQFFIPKTDANKDFILTDSEYRKLLGKVGHGLGPIQDRRLTYATEILGAPKRFFHWFLEFPEVFDQGGFDCILGNPPYLGGSKISGNYGDEYYYFIKSYYPSTHGICDLVAFFLLRDYKICSDLGFIALITTNSISQGDTRDSSLEFIRNKGAKFCFAIKSKTWPGVANLNVSLLAISKNVHANLPCFLDGKSVENITSYFDSSENSSKPYVLQINSDLSFDGTKIYGDGFLLSLEEKRNLIESDINNSEVIFEYLGGEDLNDSPTFEASRYVINFFDWPIERAQKYKLAFNIVEQKVKPYRETVKREKTKRLWWLFEERRVRLYERIDEVKTFFVATKTSKYLSFVQKEKGIVFSSALVVITHSQFRLFSFMQCTLHLIWVEKYSSTLETRLRYTGTDSFETFPFAPIVTKQSEKGLDDIGKQYHDYRNNRMITTNLGLTKTYNFFHSQKLSALENVEWLEDQMKLEKQQDKYAVHLIKHLQKTFTGETPGQIFTRFNEAVKGITELRRLHVEMDNAVLDAYGWSDVSLKHDFYEVDYLPENDRVRYTIHPDARKEILKRLLALNHQIHEEEVKAGLWEKKKSGKKKGAESLGDEGEGLDLFS